jgi:hypothetical protein
MKTTSRAGLYVGLPNADLRWALRSAAADRRTDTRRLVIDILTAWLRDAGYGLPQNGTPSETER